MKKFIFAMLLALPMTMFAQKIGHVDVDEVAKVMPEVTAFQTEFQNLQRQFQEELERKQTAFQTKAETYEKEKGGLSEALRSFREEELKKDYEALGQFQQTCAQELERVSTTKQGEIMNKILAAIKEVGAAGSYTYILPVSGIYYVGAGSNDVTEQVKAKVSK